jgi:hypothetical protein
MAGGYRVCQLQYRIDKKEEATLDSYDKYYSLVNLKTLRCHGAPRFHVTAVTSCHSVTHVRNLNF